MAYAIGDRIGDYEIVDVLGAGGMGKVYKVRNVISERVEAMKVLLPTLQSDPDLADRFMREIKVQASLQHPNIAALHTAQRLDNQLVMLIEFVEGRTLATELRNGALPLAKAVEYTKQVLLALAYAHSHGVVHRDIKPANMMVTADGTVKLMDFGIARLSADRRLTQTGHTVGSLCYMSPEQIQGTLDLDARTDLYSLGVSLYELLTNRRPFQGDSDYSIMAAHLSANPVPPIEIDPSLPPGLNDLMLMAIAKDPAKRFQTADAFRAALNSVVPGAWIASPSVTRVVAAPSGAAAVAAVPPIPVASAPVPQPVAAASQPKSRRGLYMATGSVVTVAVLAIAALQAPKLFKSSAASEPPASSASVETLPRALTPAPASEPAAQPQVPTARDLQAEKIASAEIPKATPPQTAPVQQAGASPPPAQLLPASSAPGPMGAAVPAPDAGRPEALQSAREQLMLLGTRANAARASLTTMKQQQARMGLNLRGDILTAEQRMEFYLDDAEAALKAGNAAQSKRSLDSAERAIETVETFLGR